MSRPLDRQRLPITWSVLVCFLLSTCLPAGNLLAAFPLSFTLPAANQPIALSNAYQPIQLVGLKLDKKDPFKMEFVMDQGQDTLADQAKRRVYMDQVKYFMAALSLADDNLWVNLSVYEKDRVVDAQLAQTKMGTVLLAQDYILKQMMASLMDPRSETGKKFWQRLYQEVGQELGSTDLPVDTFHKVWVLPDKAYVKAEAGQVWLVKSQLKLMLEEDYLAMSKQQKIVSMPNDQLAFQRIKQRVKEGGHDVPLVDIKRRFKRSFQNFKTLYGPLCDLWILFDNSGIEPVEIDREGNDK